ncbi:MAG: hypothetical protein E7464_07810 [Ruminococcaceae bacterium]|nr:hypothetical protein [Oscillospiraceae bacterium]
MQMREGQCPKCGKRLQIPEELKEFSCLYCGSRLFSYELITEEEKPADAVQDYKVFTKEALHAAVDFPDSMGRVTKTEFFSYFDSYYAQCAAPFEALERCTLAYHGNREDFLAKAAKELMQKIEDWFEAQKGWKLRHRRSEIIERTKFTIAIFMVPTIRKCAPEIGLSFSKKLRELWMDNHPDSPFELATYDDLANGFKKRPLCFITTAVCEFRGQADDCAMLQDFRAFRDGYLMSCADGAELVREYYDCAPGIVSRIDFCEDRKTVYDRLYLDYLTPCHEALRRGELSACKERYVNMMHDLKKQYQMN